MSKEFKRPTVEHTATFLADMDASNLELVQEFNGTKNKEDVFGQFNRIGIPKTDPNPRVLINMKHLSALQETNPAIAILINKEGKIAKVGEECIVNPEKRIGCTKRKLFVA